MNEIVSSRTNNFGRPILGILRRCREAEEDTNRGGLPSRHINSREGVGTSKHRDNSWQNEAYLVYFERPPGTGYDIYPSPCGHAFR
jgi:hypothetical protein